MQNRHMSNFLLSLLSTILVAGNALAQANCNDETVTAYHDCILGCGNIGETQYYSCLESCHTSTILGDCVNDQPIPGGLHYHSVVRAFDTYCNCPQGGISNKAQKKCVKYTNAIKVALKKALKPLGLIDSDFLALYNSFLRTAKNRCK